MRNYNQLKVTYAPEDKEAVEAALLQRARLQNGSFGIFSQHSKASTYIFEPPLTEKEIKGLVAKLIDLNVKGFCINDTASLTRRDAF